MEPIKPIHLFLYKCDSKFHTELLKEMLQSDDRYGFIVMDGNGVLLASVVGNDLKILAQYAVDLPKKHGRGGQSALRFMRLRLEARHNFLTKICEMAAKSFLDVQTNKVNCRGIVVAGSAGFKDQLVSSKMLDPRIQSSLISVVDVAYGGRQGLEQAIELSAKDLKNCTLLQQKKILSRLFEEISTDSGKFCFGVEDTLAALESGAVETLLVWENLPIVRSAMRTTSGDDHKVICSDPNSPKSVSSNQDLQWEVESSELLVDWFAENYSKFGAKLELLQDCTSEGSQFCRGFGGCGALLRYPVTSLRDCVEPIEQEQEEDHKEDEEEDDIDEYFM